MPYINIWIHCIWATQNRHPFLTDTIRPEVIKHIRENAEDKKIHVDFINGYKDHIHALISLAADQSIATVIQLLKGESSFWINKNKMTRMKFSWQDEYAAFSVSYSTVDKVRDYIKGQEVHHKIRSFTEEYKQFLQINGFTAKAKK